MSVTVNIDVTELGASYLKRLKVNNSFFLTHCRGLTLMVLVAYLANIK